MSTSPSTSPPASRPFDLLADEVPRNLAALAELVNGRDWKASRQEIRRLMRTADEHTRALIARCITVLDDAPDQRVAAARLRHLATISEPADKPIILAFLPSPDYRPARPGAEPPAPDHGAGPPMSYYSPGTVHTRWEPPAPPRRPRARPGEHGLVETYLRERGEVDDQPARPQPPVGYERDYDADALDDLRGLPCVSCNCECSARDRRRADGLCEDCRESGKPGIRELPAGHTLEQAIEARCEFLVRTKGAGAAAALRQLRSHVSGSRAHRALAAFLDAHPALNQPHA